MAEPVEPGRGMEPPAGSLMRRAIVGQTKLVVALGLLLFVPAWSLAFWQGWVYWLVVTLSTSAIMVYLLVKDPALVERRMKVGASAETEPSQKRIQTAAGLAMSAILIAPGLLRHIAAPELPVIVVGTADGLILLSFWIIFLTFRENSHASGIVEVHPGQTVIATGPYALVRHPMYAGAALMFLATPPALGSAAALVFSPVVVGVLVMRLLDEERFLSAQLAGYDAYCRKVPWRLVPLVW